ncbi:MAG: ParB/RepB/Spo0J family partition protein [Patescibacteria group bacterium]|mgnify:FL=1
MSLGRGLGSLIPDKKTIAPESNGISISLIDPNPYQPRKEFDEAALKGLADSIAEHGLLQPIIVSSADAGRYYLVVGERRLRAAKMAGLKTIPAIVRTTEDQQKLELALIENVQREDLNQLEEGLAYRRLMDEFGLTPDEVSKRVGKSKPEVYGRLGLIGLPDEVKEAFVSGKISYKRARALAILREEPENLMALWREAVENKWDDGELERMATQRRSTDVGSNRRKMSSPRLNPVVLEKQRELEEVFGTKIMLTNYNGRSSIQFRFFSEEEFFKTVERLLSLRDE